MAESVLLGMLGRCFLPIVIYLDDTALYGDTKEQVLKDTLEAIKWLAVVGFMLNLHKSQLIQAVSQVLWHLCTLGSFWAPNINNFTTLMENTNGELALVNWASFWRLLSFYIEYVLAFAELVGPLCQNLSHNTQSWMLATGEYIHEVAQCIIMAPYWLNADRSAELRMKTRVSSHGIVNLILHCHPDKLQTWMPMASWGYCLELLEKVESHLLLELKVLHWGHLENRLVQGILLAPYNADHTSTARLV